MTDADQTHTYKQLKTPIATGVFLGASIMYSQMYVTYFPLLSLLGHPHRHSHAHTHAPTLANTGSCFSSPSSWGWRVPPIRTRSGRRTTPWPSSPSSSLSSMQSSAPASSASGTTSLVRGCGGHVCVMWRSHALLSCRGCFLTLRTRTSTHLTTNQTTNTQQQTTCPWARTTTRKDKPTDKKGRRTTVERGMQREGHLLHLVSLCN